MKAPDHALIDEHFGSPEDVIKAHKIVEEELGPDFDINYFALPKNVGVVGDQRFYGRSLLISTYSRVALRHEIQERKYKALEEAVRRLCSETQSTSRVFIDLTPERGIFEVAE